MNNELDSLVSKHRTPRRVYMSLKSINQSINKNWTDASSLYFDDLTETSAYKENVLFLINFLYTMLMSFVFVIKETEK